MVEKTIHLDNVSLVDFLGTENRNIREISQAFPHSKIISRGSDLHIKGSTPEIVRINEIINALLEHYNTFGKVTPEHVQSYLQQHPDDSPLYRSLQEDAIIYGVRGEAIKPKTINQQRVVDAAFANDLVFAMGPAGTGKTYMAVAMAVRALKNKQVRKIIITRPAVEAGENLGFLPGDLKEKIDPYLRPIYDALDDMIPAEKLKFYQEKNIIEIAPIAYMRGRTLNNAFVLLDEAQNTTPMQIKMVLTRLGPNSKMIVTGDRTQIDLPRKQKSGLIEAMQVLQGIDGIGIVELDGKDVVRHKLVRKIIDAYKHHDEETGPKPEGPSAW